MFAFVEDQNCGFWACRGYRTQNGEATSGPICTIVKNFTPIGVTVAEICHIVPEQTKNKCASKTHIDKRGDAVITMCNTLGPFPKATFSSLIDC